MDKSYPFSFQRRLRGALPPLAVAGVFVLLLVVFQPERAWVWWGLLVLAGLMLARAAQYLWWGRNAVVIDSRGLSRSGRTMPYDGAELELRCVEKAGALRVREVVLWGPHPAEGPRAGLGFDDSLSRFDQAVRTLVSKVPELRIRVSTLSEGDVQGPLRETVIGPLRPTPAERALLELGRSALGAPPHLRN